MNTKMKKRTHPHDTKCNQYMDEKSQKHDEYMDERDPFDPHFDENEDKKKEPTLTCKHTMEMRTKQRFHTHDPNNNHNKDEKDNLPT